MLYKLSFSLLCTVALCGAAFGSTTGDVVFSEGNSDSGKSDTQVKASVVVADVPFFKGSGDRPTHAKPGEVWCLVTLPPMYKTVSEQVCVEPASCTCETIPAEYETVSEKVCVCSAKERCIKTTAEYTTETYTVEVCPARTEMREIECAEVNLASGETKGKCFALVTIPAVTKECSRQILVTPASTRYELIPAEYKTVEKRVCVKPEMKHQIDIPARYETRTKEVCVSSGEKVWRLTSCGVPEVSADCSTCKVKVSNDCAPCKARCNTCLTEDTMYSNNYNDGYTREAINTSCRAREVSADCSTCKVKVSNDCAPCKARCNTCRSEDTMYDNNYNDGYTHRK